MSKNTDEHYKGRNDHMNEIPGIDPKFRKYSITIGLCSIVIALIALAVSNTDIKTQIKEQTTAAETQVVEAKVTGVPDNRIYETIIVPATEMTTSELNTETATEELTTRSAPVSYSLPLGTDMGNDYSMGVPVYNAIMDDWRTHDGVDFNGAYGDDVKAIADGIIRDVYDDEIMGATVVVDHGGGVVATYCGVIADENIRRGVLVEKCDILGKLSTIPGEADAEFPHLHLEIAVNDKICDPLEVMGLDE